MTDENGTLRLLYPQWQGGIISHWMPDIPPEDAARGYYLGARILDMLAPAATGETVEVPVSLDYDRRTENGICSYRTILRQTAEALAIVRDRDPERIVTLGGECSVSVVPFTYLAAKYPDDVAVVWIDAHPDITLPYDEYAGYHAMALTACLGMGDKAITDMLPGKFDASKVLIVGLRSWDPGMRERQERLGIEGLSPEETRNDCGSVLEWLKETGARKVVVHLDLDVLDPAEIIAGVGVEPGGMKIDETATLIRDIAARYDMVGLTVAEPMPRTAIKLRDMLAKLPLLGDSNRRRD